MKIGILEADHVAEELVGEHGTYPDMFKSLLLGVDESLDFEVFTVIDGEFPESLDCDAYLITGSKFSAYEDIPWIHQLNKLIVKLYEEKIPLIGICFGHQLIAIALGGNTGKAEQGWGVGCYQSSLLETPEWMVTKPTNSCFRLLVSHQDQVLSLPNHARLLATNRFCPNSMYQVGKTVLTFQGHPEFTHAYDKALMDRRKNILGGSIYGLGIESLKYDEHGALIASWIIEFIRYNK